MSRFAGLNRAQLSYDYLHTNSTTHEFLFGAMVEMVDNSKDAAASTCAIWTMPRPHLRGGRILCISDDGGGMTPEEAQAVTTFGYSAKRRDPDMIGQYGNGLKSGAMRIGKDMIVFTKKDDAMTCIFLSRTFHDEEGIDEIIVPTPSFSLDGTAKAGDRTKHELEMQLILKYSPFHTVPEFKEQFNWIKNKSGTLIMVYNLKLLENGHPELDFDSDPYDIRLSDPDGGDRTLVPERTSLRAYLSVIYSTPHMKLYLNGRKVRTRCVVGSLYKPRQYKFSSARFKTRAEQQIKELKEILAATQERTKEADMKLKEFERKWGNDPMDKEVRMQWRKMQDDVMLNKSEIDRLKRNTEAKIKLLKEPKTLNFMFGLNVENRSHDGCFIYNNGRLIKMYEKTGPQCEGGVRGSGVVGVVDVPFTVMEPTHNKQDFADSREYRQLLRAMGEHLDQYWRDLNLAAQPGGLMQFWQQFGYLNGTGDWSLPPSTEERFVKKRLMNVNITLQCDTCLKWRVLPYDSRCLKEDWPSDTWTCANNPDTSNNKCQHAEKPISIPTGKLEKESATVEQKREQLQKKIEKQQAEVEKLTGLTTVRSRRDVVEATERRRKEQEAAAAAAAVALKRTPVKRPTAPPPPPPRPRNISIRSSTRKRVRTPSPPPPPPKKPRTKAELRKQLQNQKKADEVDDDEDDEESEPEFEVLKVSPPKKVKSRESYLMPIPATTTPPPPPPSLPLVRSNARKSIANSNFAKTPDSSTTTVSSGAKKVSVQKEEAHSTANIDNEIVADRSLSPPDEKAPTTSGLTSTSIKNDSTKIISVRVVETSANETKEAKIDKAASTTTSQQDVSVDDAVAKKLRHFMYYFLPPNFKYTKEEVGKMPKERLLDVDLADFFQAYEAGLKKLVTEHQKVAETAQNELKNLRQMCTKFAESQNVEMPDTDDGSTIDRALVKFFQEFNRD